MSLKKQIEQNNEKLKQYRDFVDAIDLLEKSKDDKKAIAFLLEIQKLEFTGRIERGEKQQAILEKQYLAEFEAVSAEANLRLDKLITEISKWIGKDPIGVTSKIQPLVEAYGREKGDYTQEQRNEVYTELSGHYKFLTETFKNK
jgi:hypothetical protein